MLYTLYATADGRVIADKCTPDAIADYMQLDVVDVLWAAQYSDDGRIDGLWGDVPVHALPWILGPAA